MPPAQFVKKENGSKNDHVNTEEAFGYVVNAVGFIVHDSYSAQGTHGGRKTDAPKRKKGEKATAFSSVIWKA